VRIVLRIVAHTSRVHTCVSRVGTWARASYTPLQLASCLRNAASLNTSQGGDAYVRGKEILRSLSHDLGRDADSPHSGLNIDGDFNSFVVRDTLRLLCRIDEIFITFLVMPLLSLLKIQ